MERTESNGVWRLFDPADVPALFTTYGGSFTAQYEEYERTVNAVSTIPARELWALICRAQEASGGPFIMFQDAVNSKCEFVGECV